jgi:hypothetical protein
VSVGAAVAATVPEPSRAATTTATVRRLAGGCFLMTDLSASSGIERHSLRRTIAP